MLEHKVAIADALMALVQNFTKSLYNLIAQIGCEANDCDTSNMSLLRPVRDWYKTWLETEDGQWFITYYLSSQKEIAGMSLDEAIQNFLNYTGEIGVEFRAARAAHLYQVVYHMLSDAQLSHIDGSNHEAGNRVSAALESGLNTAIASYMERP